MAGRYRLDANRSRFTVQAFAGGMLSTFGHNPTFAVRNFMGEAQFTPGKLDSSSLYIKVSAESLGVIDNISEKDRREMENKMRQEVLEIAIYPDIVFQSTDVSANKIAENGYWVEIKGNLSLHGVTRSEKIEAQVRVNGDDLRANGEFTLRQSDYKIKRVSAALGSIKLKDELKLSFDIAAHQKGIAVDDQ